MCAVIGRKRVPRRKQISSAGTYVNALRTNRHSQPLKRSSSEFRNVWALCITVSAQICQIVGLVEEGLRVLLELVLIEAIHLLALEHELVIIVVIVRIL